MRHAIDMWIFAAHTSIDLWSELLIEDNRIWVKKDTRLDNDRRVY